MSVALLLFVVAISLSVVRLSALLLELTGIPWEEAKFHALSAFTNTGFPTHQSAELVAHPLRRRIVSALIVLGNAGLITTVATLAGSLIEGSLLINLRNLALILLGVSFIVWISHQRWFAQPLRRFTTDRIRRRYQFAPPSVSELLQLGHGYALSRYTVGQGAEVAGRSLAELALRGRGLQVLAIERAGTFIASPAGHDVLQSGDEVVVYAAQGRAEALFCAAPRESASA